MPINSEHPQYTDAKPRWERCRDAYDGQDAIHKAGTKYLPRLTKQLDEDYKAYLERALFYGATERTVQGLTGAAISKDFAVTLPTSLGYLDDECTCDCMCLDEFIKWMVNDMLLQGRIGVLVERDAAGLRPPYLVPYMAEQIINWTEEDGKLTRVVLAEDYYAPKSPDDPYELVTKKRWRELTLDAGVYVQKLHTKKEQGDGFDVETTTPSKRGSPLDFIPFVIANAKGIGSACGKPPLLALVDVNISHYRNSADLEHGRHYTGLPTPWVAGAKVESELRIGSAAAWVFDDSDTKVGFLEFTGQGLGALERAQEQKETQMAILGARLLEGAKAGVEAAETVRMRQMGDVFTLAGINDSVSDALEVVLSYADKWQGGSGDGIEVEPNMDFVDRSLSAQEITALVGAWTAGAISLETFLWNLKSGERMNNDIDEEIAAIEKNKADSPKTLPELTPEERAQLGLPPKPMPGQPAAAGGMQSGFAGKATAGKGGKAAPAGMADSGGGNGTGPGPVTGAAA